MRDNDLERVYFEEREGNLAPAHPESIRGHRPKLKSRRKAHDISQYRLPFFSLSDIRYQKVSKIKNLVKKGQYETEEKIRATATRILETL